MRLSAKGAMKTRSDARKVMGFGKRWKSGETHIVGYPIFWDDNNEPQILVGQVWGHPVDPKAISAKCIFWPSHSEIVDGEPKVADLAYQAARIMPLILKGSYAAEVKKIEDSNISASAKKSSLKEVDKRFEVDDEGRIGKQPAIGRLKLIVTTEIFNIPLTSDMKLNAREARIVSQDLSDEKIRSLTNLMMNPNYAPKPGDKVFWVQYAFGSSGDKKLDGRVAPTGFNEGYLPHERFPEEFAKLANDVESLPTSSDSIMKRNTVFKKGDERDLMSALQTYWILNEDKLDNLSEDTDIERLRKVAKIVRDLKVPVNNAILKEEVEALETEEKALPSVINTNPYHNEEAAPDMRELVDKADIESAKAESGQDEDESSDLNDVSTNFAAMADQ